MSDFWQWTFAIIGLAGFIMAFPFFLQLLFGQPSIGYVFREDDTGLDGKLIKMHLVNLPVSNPILKWLKVSRMTAQDVYITVAVVNAVTREEACQPYVLEISMSQASKDGRVSLPPSRMPAWVTLVQWQRDTNSALLLGRTQSLALRKGRYLVSFQGGLDGKFITFRKVGLLHVGDTEQELRWDEKITNVFFPV